MMLAQEFLKDKPWQLLATCILLNQTDGKRQVKPMLADFFERWPTAEKLLIAHEQDVKSALRPAGFQNVKYLRLIGMSKDWLQGKRPPEKLYGVGKYAVDSYKLFCQGYLVLDAEDKELKRYVQWAREREEDCGNSRPRGVQLSRQTGAFIPHASGGKSQREDGLQAI
jgi:hypothetical protein